MTGEILRLKSFRHYNRKLKRGEAGMQSADAKARPGQHIVVVTIAQVPEDMELSQEFITARMRALGWKEMEPSTR